MNPRTLRLMIAATALAGLAFLFIPSLSLVPGRHGPSGSEKEGGVKGQTLRLHRTERGQSLDDHPAKTGKTGGPVRVGLPAGEKAQPADPRCQSHLPGPEDHPAAACRRARANPLRSEQGGHPLSNSPRPARHHAKRHGEMDGAHQEAQPASRQSEQDLRRPDADPPGQATGSPRACRAGSQTGGDRCQTST